MLEEPPRVPAEAVYREVRDEEEAVPRAGEGARRRRERRLGKGTADPERFRERIREETARDLRDHDYDVMAEMAAGIRPILDRLDEIENRVIEMEEGEEPVPANPRGWLSEQLEETLGGSRGSGKGGARMNPAELEARLPELIDRAVTERFQSMAGKLQQEIEEQHIQTLEAFVKNIQVKLVQRVSALETDMSKQAEAMNQLREYSQRTEDNLSRLITGVDKLAQELPRRLAAPEAQPVLDAKPVKRKSSSRALKPLLGWIAILLLAALAYGIVKLAQRRPASGELAPPAGSSAAAAAAPGKVEAPSPGADTKTRMQAAEQYAERKDYATAEDIYRQILKAEPNNIDARKALADVLYREDKIDESAAELDKLPRN